MTYLKNKLLSTNIIIFYWVLAILVFPIFYGSIYDETLESSKIILNIIKYTDGHPNQFHLFAFNLSNYISAFILSISNDNILNNFRFIFVNIIQMLSFLYITKILTNTLWAQIILIFLYLGSISAFNVYLNYSNNFPNHFATHGGFGLSLFVLFIGLVISNKYKMASFIIGLLPAFHLGFIVPIIIWCLYKIIIDKQGKVILAKGNIYAFIIGIIIPIFTYIIIQWRVDSIIPIGLYEYKDIDYKLWFDFIINYDRHRSGPLLSSYLPLLISLYFLVLIKANYAKHLDNTAKEFVKIVIIICALYLSVAVIANIINYLLNYLQSDSSYYKASFLLLSWMPYRYDSVILLLTVLLSFKILFDALSQNVFKLEIIFVLCLIIFVQIIFLILNQDAIDYYRQFMLGSFWQLAEAILNRHSANNCLSNNILKKLHMYIKNNILCGFLLVVLLLCFITNKVYWLNNIQYILYGCILMKILFYIIDNIKQFRLMVLIYNHLTEVIVVMVLSASLILIVFHNNTLKTSVGNNFMMEFSEHKILDRQISTYFSTNYVDDGKYVVVPLSRTWRFFSAKHNIPIIFTSDTMHYGFYMPNYMNIIHIIFVEIYGIKLFKDKLFNPHKSIWISRSYKKWRELSSKYNIQYIMTDYKLHNLLPSFESDELFIYKL
jgi:hypothetical protein